MPNNIDERIVEMRIDNRQFVKGANKTINVLDKLKSALNFKDQMYDLNKFEQSIRKVDFSALSNALEKITDRFSDLGIIGKRVLENLVDSLYNFTSRSVKALSIDQITSGYSKYEQKMKSVQTMMGATANQIGDKYANQEEQLSAINAQMDRLVFFTDETSYSFEGMARNMASFISAGVDIESARIDMQGVAAAAGLAGASVEQATRVMNNLSQAIAMGSLKLQDWVSLEAAGFVTKEFEEVLADTAVECGKLTKTADGMYKTIAKGSQKTITFAAEGIRSALSTGFADKEVIEKVLHKYGEFSDVLNTVSDNTGATATDLLAALDSYGKGELNFAEFQKELADSIDEEELPSILALEKAMEILSDKQLDLGRRAFAASQEYNSFTDAINATKDAVSTGWMTTFEYIFGDYLEAKKVWTAIGDELYDIFAAGASRRNSIMEIWHDEGGRDSFLESFRNIFDAFMSLIEPVKKAFQNIFRLGKGPREAANKLIEITDKFKKFTESLGASESFINKIQTVFETFFGIIHDVGGSAFDGLLEAGREIKRVFEPISNAVSSIFSSDDIKDFAVFIGDIVTRFSNFVSQLTLSDEALNGIENILSKVLGLIDTSLDDIDDSFFSKVLSFLGDIVLDIFDVIEGILESEDALNAIYEVFESIFNFVQGSIQRIGYALSPIWEEIKRIFTPLKNAAETVFTADQISRFVEIFDILIGKFTDFISKLKFTDKALEGLEYILTTIFGAIRDGIEGTINDNSLFSKVFSFIGKLIMFFRNLANAVLEAFAGGFNGKTLAEGLSTAFHGLSDTLGTIWDFVSSIFQWVGQFISNIKNGLDQLGGIVGIITSVFQWLKGLIDQIRESLQETFSDNSIGSDIIKIAVGIVAIIKAFFSGRDMVWLVEKIIGPIKFLYECLEDVFWQFERLFAAARFSVWSNVLKKFGIAILAIAAALWILASLDVDKLGKSLAVLTVVMGELIGVLVVLSNMSKIFEKGLPGKLSLMSLALVEIAAALLILAVAITILSFADITKVWSSVGALATLLALILVLTDQIEKKGMGRFALFGLALIEIAAAIAILAVALTLLSLADMTKVWSSVGALVVFLALILVFTTQLEDPLILMAAGLALIEIAVAIAILAAAITLVSLIDYGKMYAAAGALVLLVAALAVIAMLAQEFILGAAVLILLSVAAIAMAAAFLVLAVAMNLLTGIDIALICIELLALIPVLFGLSLVGAAFTTSVLGLLGGAVAIAALGLAVAVLAMGLKQLADVKPIWVLEFLVLFAGSAAALSILAPILGPAAIAIAAFGAACALAGAGIYLAGEGMEKIANSLRDIPELAKGSLLDIVATMKTAIADIKPAGEEAVIQLTEVANNMIMTIQNKSYAIIGLYGNLTNMCINILDTVTDTFRVLGGNLDAGIANGIYERADDPIQAMHWLAYEMIRQFGGDFQINSPSKLMADMASYIPIGAAKGIEDSESIASDAMNTLGSDMLAAIYPSLQALQLLLNEEYDFSPTITPIVDMSNVDSSAAAMRNMLASADMSASINAKNIDAMISNAGRITEEMNAMNAGQSINGDSFVINVYSQPGMDENELANAVMYKIQNGIIRKGAALG